MTQPINDIITVDYRSKTKNMCTEMNLPAEDINSLVMFLNYCFTMKNNFFIENFNKGMIKNVYHVYNKMKTNIFSESENLYTSLLPSDTKLLKFILSNFLSNYKKISDKQIKSYINETQLKNIIGTLHGNNQNNS
jgi:hypothetical protein